MQQITEHGCEKCGGRLMNPQPRNIFPGGPTPPPSNKCEKCGHITEITKMRGFKCSGILQSLLHRELTEHELNQLRMNPAVAVEALSAKLVAKGKQALEVDLTTNPPTLHQKA